MSTSEILKPTVVRPEVSEFSQLAETAPKVAETLATVENLTAQLPPLLGRAKSIEVKFPEPDGYLAIGAVLTEVRGLRKQGEAHLSPFETLVDRVRIFLRTAREKHTSACTDIENIIKPKMKAWEHAELEATAREQKQLEKKAERTGQPAGQVQHNIPATTGYRRSTVYRIEVTDRAKFLRAYRSDPARYDRYILIDVQKMQADLRDIKDVKAFAKAIPGVRAWTE